MENLINSIPNLTIPQIFIIRAKMTQLNPNLVKKDNTLYWDLQDTSGEIGFKLDITTNNLIFYKNHKNVQTQTIVNESFPSTPYGQINSFISHWLYRVFEGYVF